MAMAVAMLRNGVALTHTQPDGSLNPSVNYLAYVAIFIAGLQSVIAQAILIHNETSLNWFGAPLIGVWQVVLIVWFVGRVRWHQDTRDA